MSPKAALYFGSTGKNKNIETALEICEKMTALPAKRNAKLLAFGGGIVQDVAGFASNILYRGIRWSFFQARCLRHVTVALAAKLQ